MLPPFFFFYFLFFLSNHVQFLSYGLQKVEMAPRFPKWKSELLISPISFHGVCVAFCLGGSSWGHRSQSRSHKCPIISPSRLCLPPVHCDPSVFLVGLKRTLPELSLFHLPKLLAAAMLPASPVVSFLFNP